MIYGVQVGIFLCWASSLSYFLLPYQYVRLGRCFPALVHRFYHSFPDRFSLDLVSQYLVTSSLSQLQPRRAKKDVAGCHRVTTRIEVETQTVFLTPLFLVGRSLSGLDGVWMSWQAGLD